MKNILRFICVMFSVLTTMNPLLAQWVQVGLDSLDVHTLAFTDTNLFAGTHSDGVFRSTDNGTNWTQIGLDSVVVNAFALSGTNLFAGTWGGIFRSTDNGDSWILVNNHFGVTSLAINTSGHVFAGAVTFSQSGIVLLSTDNGANWTGRLLPGSGVTSLAINASGQVFAGTYIDGVFRSTNNGTNWTQIGLDSVGVNAFASSGTNLLAGTYRGVFLSTDDGTSWTQTTLDSSVSVFAFAISGTNLFAGTGFCNVFCTDGRVFVSTNDGTSWTEASTSLITNAIQALAVSDTYLFAGSWGFAGGVWRGPLAEMITSAEMLSTNLPAHFHLAQNYPNPFNPETRIKFQISNSNFVSLKVYNLLGQEVATLVEEEMRPGSYDVTWDAGGFASGVYLYRLTAGAFTETRKLTLMR